MNEKTLIKWYEAKEKLNKLEEKIKKYKSQISKEMNKEEVDKLTFGEFSVTRRRNTRESLSKSNVPEEIWNKYSTRFSFDSFFLTKSKKKEIKKAVKSK